MYIYGIHPVEEVLRRAPEAIKQIVVVGGLNQKQFSTVEELWKGTGIAVQKVSVQELDEWSEGGNHQRIAARVEEFPYASMEEVLRRTESNPKACLLALDQVQDPGNLGAILRSAAALGVHGVLIPRHRSASITAAVVRSSAGMAFQLPIVEVTNLARCLKELKEHGFWVVGTVADQGQDLWSLDWEMKAVVVMGGEHKGIRPGIEKVSDFRVEIPLAPEVESLNVSAAAAVTLYDRLRSLRRGGEN